MGEGAGSFEKVVYVEHHHVHHHHHIHRLGERETIDGEVPGNLRRAREAKAEADVHRVQHAATGRAPCQSAVSQTSHHRCKQLPSQARSRGGRARQAVSSERASPSARSDRFAEVNTPCGSCWAPSEGTAFPLTQQKMSLNKYFELISQMPGESRLMISPYSVPTSARGVASRRPR